MSPPRWVDADGQLCPTRPCPTCERAIPTNRWPVLRTGAIRQHPYEVLSVVGWCGHRQELILVPDGEEWFSGFPCWAWRRELLGRAFEDLVNERLELPLLPDGAGDEALEHSPRQHQASVSSAFPGCPGGLGRLSVTVLAICSGVGALRRAAGAGVPLGVRQATEDVDAARAACLENRIPRDPLTTGLDYEGRAGSARPAPYLGFLGGRLRRMEASMTPSRAGRLVSFVLFAALAGGCATTQDLDTVPPSFLLRAAYVTNVVPPGGWLYGPWARVLPARHTEIDPAKDSRAAFIIVFSSPQAMSLSGSLKSPDGAAWRRFGTKLDQLTVVSHPDYWRYWFWTFRTAGMEKNPGLWSIDLLLNDVPMGTYRFWLGDPATVVRLKKQGGAVASVMPERLPVTGAAEPVSSLRNRAERGDGGAMAALGFMSFTGSGGLAKDDPTAVSWFRKGAEAGSGSAMAFLGASYWVGLAGLSRDEAEAVRWFRKGADAGNGRAMASLGQTYLTGGGGLARDEGEAVRWFRQGAERDDGRAMAMLGQMYLTGGGGLAADEAEAVRWMRKGADSGDGLAMAMLGGMYETGGGGLARDDAEAVRWYQRGAEAGSGRAMAALGRMYSEGRGGLATSSADAVRWYRAGANLADASAMFELARAYETGDGVPKDRQQAIQWYRKSAALAHPDAVERLQTIEQ